MEILTAAAAFLIAALSGMGVGSGGLFVAYLTLVCGVSQLRAQGLNLAFFLFASSASMLVHLTRRNISLSRVALVSLAGILAAIPGSYAAMLLPESLVRKLFGAMLLLSGLLGLFRKSTKKTSKSP